MARRSASLTLLFALLGAVPSAQAGREFREYPGLEADAWAPLPADYKVPGEFVVGRLMYPGGPFGWFGFGDWTQGGTAWAVDYPKGDRFFARVLRRLTTINVRSVEQPVNLDDGDDVYDWPFLIVGLPGMWDLTDAQVAKLRDYLLRGGFLLCDSFFGTREWDGFVRGMNRIFPGRPIIDLPDDHPLFHTVYDLTGKGQVPNWNALRAGVPIADVAVAIEPDDRVVGQPLDQQPELPLAFEQLLGRRFLRRDVAADDIDQPLFGRHRPSDAPPASVLVEETILLGPEEASGASPRRTSYSWAVLATTTWRAGRART